MKLTIVKFLCKLFSIKYVDQSIHELLQNQLKEIESKPPQIVKEVVKEIVKVENPINIKAVECVTNLISGVERTKGRTHSFIELERAKAFLETVK